ncbi:hypothetical protein WJX74_001472 [Apatococcus lobatus]|uniref:Uncharacterized protein n=1 Tax=Apatococcus lobatus TaxID=904363 RepID=A0AAW1QKU5_9CHLO
MPDCFVHELLHRERSGKGRRLAHRLSRDRASLLDFSQRKLIVPQHEARNNSSSHKYSITSVAWYPIDSGLFATGSLDNDVKVWDTNIAQAVCTFPFGAAVCAIGMSPVAAAHCLVAVAGAQPQIKLCDPASGSFTHVLGGHAGSHGSHREDVWSLHWCLQNEWHLVTGGCDGQVRMWDVRQSACFHMLDEQQTNKPATPAPRSARRHSQGRKGAHAPKLAAAHEGSVTAIQPTTDGRHLLTAGTDSRLRLWDTCDYRNLLVNYRNTFNRANKARQIAASVDGNLVFHPSGSVVQVLDMYTGADDASIILWTKEEVCAQDDIEGQEATGDADCWSD